MSGVTAIHWLATAETDSWKLCITVALYKRYLTKGPRSVLLQHSATGRMNVVQLCFIFL